jgi:hypothetical protein
MSTPSESESDIDDEFDPDLDFEPRQGTIIFLLWFHFFYQAFIHSFDALLHVLIVIFSLDFSFTEVAPKLWPTELVDDEVRRALDQHATLHDDQDAIAVCFLAFYNL